MEYLLCTCVRLGNPLDLKSEELWSLCLPPSQCPVFLLVSYLEVSAGAQVQLLSPEPKLVAAAPPGPVCCLPHFCSCPRTHLPHLQSTELRGATHQPPPQHNPTPPCLHCPSPRCASRKLPHLQPLPGLSGGRGEGSPSQGHQVQVCVLCTA